MRALFSFLGGFSAVLSPQCFFDSVYSTANRCSQLRFCRPIFFEIVKMIAHD